MNLQCQGIIDEPWNPIVLFFLCEGVNFLWIELIIIIIGCENDMDTQYTRCFTVDIVLIQSYTRKILTLTVNEC